MPNFPGLGALGLGLAQGLEQGDKHNLAQTELSFKRETMNRQLRQEQMKMLSEVLKRIDEDPETTLTALQDPTFAAQLGMSPNAYMAFMNTAKSKAEEVQHSRELLSLYGSNQLKPEHLDMYKRGIPRTVAANKDFAAYLDTQGMEGASAHITGELAKITDPDMRRRALPGIINSYTGRGGPGMAQRTFDKFGIDKTLQGPVTAVEDQARIRGLASTILGMYRRGALDARTATAELAQGGMHDLNALVMLIPEQAKAIEELKAAGSAAGKVIGEGEAVSRPVPGADQFGIPEVTTSGAFGEPTTRPALPRTYGDILAEQSGRTAKHQAAGTYMGPLEVFDMQNPTAPTESYGVTENRRDKAKGRAGQTDELASARTAQARLDNARAAASELAADDKNIAAAKKLVDAMSTAAIAQHILKSLPPDQATELRRWYEKAQELVRTSKVTQGATLPPRPTTSAPGALPGQGGGIVPRQAPAGGSRDGWNIQRVN